MTTKLWGHIIEPYRIRGYDPAVVSAHMSVKVVGGPSELGILSYYHEKNPNATYIARVYPFEKSIADMYALGASPGQCAETMYSLLSGFAYGSGMTWCYFEAGPNEPGDEAIDWLDVYYANLIPRLRAANIKSVAYNFSVCHPPLAAWSRLSKSLNAIKAAGKDWALVGLHQYGLLGSMQDYATAGDGARVLRHRVIPELAGVPIVLTESGLDMPGWQQTNRGVEGYLADLKWLDAELRKDQNVLGACIYTMDLDPAWAPFRVEGGLAQQLFEYITAQNAIIEVPPAPEPEEPPAALRNIIVSPGYGCNMRKQPTMSSPLLGYAAPGSKFAIRVPSQNDYVYIPSLEAWVYAPNTRYA